MCSDRGAFCIGSLVEITDIRASNLTLYPYFNLFCRVTRKGNGIMSSVISMVFTKASVEALFPMTRSMLGLTFMVRRNAPRPSYSCHTQLQNLIAEYVIIYSVLSPTDIINLHVSDVDDT